MAWAAVHAVGIHQQQTAKTQARGYGTMTSGTGEWRARLTATEPTTRWVACDELPTTIATVLPGPASPMAVATAISSWATMPWRRSNPQAATLTPQAMDLLAREHSERGRIPVLAIDEAHLLEPGQLEAIRMLTLCRGCGYPEPMPARAGSHRVAGTAPGCRSA